jgi:DNA-binding NtrC family response regulator
MKWPRASSHRSRSCPLYFAGIEFSSKSRFLTPNVNLNLEQIQGEGVMKQLSVLLLEGNKLAALAADLRTILTSTTQLGVDLHCEPIDFSGTARANGDPAAVLHRSNPDVVFLVLSTDLLEQTAEIIPSWRREAPDVPLIVILESGEPDEILELLNLGVSDFITPPLKAIDILPRIRRLVNQPISKPTFTQTLKEKLGLKQLIGESNAFQTQIKKIPLVAKCDASVLLTGETGTGKELCARAIHYLSGRARGPFVPVNCGAIPVDLVENELFGHDRGAYTGAASSAQGIIQEADGGTIFFDEIDCLPLLSQTKLLRFLQEKEYRPLGAAKVRKSNVRVIAATNSNLEAAVNDGRLRQDLYYRLNIIPLMLPPLRERQEDILLLARHFLSGYATEFSKNVTDFSAEAMQALLFYHWPGNVRELEHVIQRAVVLCDEACIQGKDIHIQNWEAPEAPEPFYQLKTRMVAQFEKNYIQQLLRSCQGNITRAAQVAQKNRRAFWQLIKKHRIDVRTFKTTA